MNCLCLVIIFIITITVFIYLFIRVFSIQLDTHPYTNNTVEYVKHPGESETNVSDYIKLINNISALQNSIELYNERIALLKSKKLDALVNVSIAKNSQYILEKEREQLQKQINDIKNIISSDEGDLALLQYESLFLQIYLWKKIANDYETSGYPELGEYQDLLFKIYVWKKIVDDVEKSID